jgi:hypothetical protein
VEVRRKREGEKEVSNVLESVVVCPASAPILPPHSCSYATSDWLPRGRFLSAEPRTRLRASTAFSLLFKLN